MRVTLAFFLLLATEFSFCESPEVFIPRVAEPLKFEDFLEMRAPAGWEGKLAKIEGFIQSNPSNGAPASQKTVVYLAYDTDQLYVVFLCFDKEPQKISASMTRRENFSDDEDWVEIYVDTYSDRRRAYDFSTNALGVQWDSRYSEVTGGSEFEGHQPSFDALWYSQGKITDQGYVIWMAIPFKSIRFPAEDSQQWRIVLGRSIPRNNEYCAWPHISREIRGTLTQSSALNGIEWISPGKNIQFIPYTSLRSFRLLETDANPPGFLTESGDPEAGLDAKFVLKDTFVFDFALNPDFSQVESDQPQVTVNERFEVFFPEKRPFFLENAQYFETPMNLVFTRRIADPQVGGRTTGKYGPYTFGFLFTNDEAPGKRVPEDDPLSGSDAFFGILRLTRDIFSQSSVGVLFTNRTFEGDSNNVFGIDFRLRLNDKWQASGQVIHTWSKPLEANTFEGTGYYALLSRSGRQLNYRLTHESLSPDFQTLTGFIPRTDYRTIENFVSYYFRPEGKVLVAWGPEFTVFGSWDYNATRLDSSYHPAFYVELQRRTFLRLHYFFDKERIRPIDFTGLTQDVDFDVPLWAINVETSYWNQATIELNYNGGRAINFVPPAGQLPYLSDISSASAHTILRPIRRLQLRNTYLYTGLKTPQGQTIFNDHIFSTRANYQFTRELSARVIVQYEATIPNPTLTSLEDRRNLNGDFLLTYLVNPWTALYVGYNGNRQNWLFTEDNNGTHVVRSRGAWINDANQFFLKFSYLLRL